MVNGGTQTKDEMVEMVPKGCPPNYWVMFVNYKLRPETMVLLSLFITQLLSIRLQYY